MVHGVEIASRRNCYVGEGSAEQVLMDRCEQIPYSSIGRRVHVVHIQYDTKTFEVRQKTSELDLPQ